jgi:hypothetical protein
VVCVSRDFLAVHSCRGLGRDYSLHLPNLLAGYFFGLVNGPVAVPWFSPAICGGVPFVADPNVAYYSLLQALAFVVDPLAAVRITFAVFALIGEIGFYRLMRGRFATSRSAALVAAVTFLFNGFFAYRILVGHLTFHPFALTPWLAYLLLPSRTEVRPFAAGALAIMGGGAIFAYAFQAGTVHGITPVAIDRAVLLLIHGYRDGHRLRPWALFGGAILVALVLSASRLTAALAFLHNVPPGDYRIPGFPSLLTSLGFAVEIAFDPTPRTAMWNGLANVGGGFHRHEWEYSVGPVAAVLILAGVAVVALSWLRGGLSRERVARILPVALAVTAALMIPVLHNWHMPGWNAFLKWLPIIASSAILTRWYMLYIPPAVLAASLAFDRVISVMKVPVAVAILSTTISIDALVDKSFYRDAEHAYDGTPIIASWHAVGSAADVPPIAGIIVMASREISFIHNGKRNNALVAGYSPLNCYQPMFGDWLKHFPSAPLQPGPTLAEVAPGILNLKNPACYLFPEENGCRPGDIFRLHGSRRQAPSPTIGNSPSPARRCNGLPMRST